MDDATENTKKPRKKRTTERGEEAKSGGGEAKRRPPRVKLEQQSEAHKGEKPRRSVEEGVPKDNQRKTAVAGTRQEAVVDKAARLVKASQSVASDSDSDSSDSYSDRSVTPAREDSWSSSGDHYEPAHWWPDDGRGHFSRERRQRDRSRSGGHGKGGRPTSRVDSRRNEDQHARDGRAAAAEHGVVARLVDPMKMSSLMQDKTDTELNSDGSFANIGHLPILDQPTGSLQIPSSPAPVPPPDGKLCIHRRHWANLERQPSELPAEESSYDLVD